MEMEGLPSRPTPSIVVTQALGKLYETQKYHRTHAHDELYVLTREA